VLARFIFVASGNLGRDGPSRKMALVSNHWATAKSAA
jgi:hypothetical protein